MDIADRAEIEEQQERDRALAEQRARAEAGADKPLVIDGRVCCRDCELPIPEERLAANPNAARCVECKARWEKAHA